MPARDGTGPTGRGNLTGWGMGWCARPSASVPSGQAPRAGTWGRGWRNWFRATGLPGWARQTGFAQQPEAVVEPPQTREEEMSALKSQTAWLKSQLESVTRRLEELDQHTEG